MTTQIEQHYIVDKNTDEVLHGPFPSEEAAKTICSHFDWFDPETHEVTKGVHEFKDSEDFIDDHDEDDTGLELRGSSNFTTDYSDSEEFHPHGGDDETEESAFFIYHPDCDEPLAGPFSNEDEATATLIIRVPKDHQIVRKA